MWRTGIRSRAGWSPLVVAQTDYSERVRGTTHPCMVLAGMSAALGSTRVQSPVVISGDERHVAVEVVAVVRAVDLRGHGAQLCKGLPVAGRG